MAATGKTPILLYGSTTATNTPTAGNLTNSSDGCEIAINVADKNLFFKDSTNTVNTVPIRQSGTSSNGWLSSTDWNTFNNKAPSFTYTTNYIPFGQGTTTPNQSSNLQFDGNTLSVSGSTTPGISILTTTVSSPNQILFKSSGPTTEGLIKLTPSSAVLEINTGRSVGWGGNISFVTDTTEKLNIASAGNVTVSTGNLVIGTSGKGIDFSATADATATSELLADYEEGTFTPTITAASGSITAYTSSGTYTKIGREVIVNVAITITNAGTGAGGLNISLPYTTASTNASAGSGIEVAAVGFSCVSTAGGSAATFSLYKYDFGTPIGTNYGLRATITYIT